METLKKRHADILKIISKKGVITSSKLASDLHVSSKTIRNEINEINKIYPELIEPIKAQGYKISDIDKLNSLLANTSSNLDIQFNILKDLLGNKSIAIMDLCDELFVSESLLMKEIKELNITLSHNNNDVKIIRKNNNLMLMGTEDETRQASSYFFMHEINHYNLNLNDYQDVFETVDLQSLRVYSKAFYEENDIKIKDIELISFVMHVAIMAERIKQKNFINNLSITNIDDKYYKLAIKYYQRIKRLLNVELNDEEIAYLATLFAGKVTDIDENNIEEMTILINKMLKEVKETYGVDFTSDSKLKDSLIVHLLGLKNRIINKTFLKNPMIEDIKQHFPILYDVSVYMAVKIQDHFKFRMYEEEISFITLHLMGSLERIKSDNEKNILIVSPVGNSGLSYFTNRLKSIHDLKINVLDVVSVFDLNLNKYHDIDLILSLTEDVKVDDVPVYKVKNLLNTDEIEEIYFLLKKSKKEISCMNFFDQDLFFSGLDFENKEDIIHFLCEKAKEKGYVDENFEEYVIEREKVAPTAYGNFFSIPHPIINVANINKIAICTLNNAIEWNNHKVKIVFLICVARNKNDGFEELFERIVALLDFPSKAKRLAKTDTYKEFIEIFFEKERNDE